MSFRVAVLIDPISLDALAWIHRAEARRIVTELRASGRTVNVEVFDQARIPSARLPLLRLSDPLMLRAVRFLTAAGVDYRGPGPAALARCYDKWSAYQSVAAHGVDCPVTRWADEADTLPRPVVLKPRGGSDSLGLRILQHGAVPSRLRNKHMLAQAQVLGVEMTVAVIDGAAGMPLRLILPEGVPYTFARKYLLRPRRAALSEGPLARRVAETAAHVASILGADWAVRVDFILERASQRLFFLECDAAPLVGPGTAFAESLAAAGMKRSMQLARLLGEI